MRVFVESGFAYRFASDPCTSCPSTAMPAACLPTAQCLFSCSRTEGSQPCLMWATPHFSLPTDPGLHGLTGDLCSDLEIAGGAAVDPFQNGLATCARPYLLRAEDGARTHFQFATSQGSKTTSHGLVMSSLLWSDTSSRGLTILPTVYAPSWVQLNICGGNSVTRTHTLSGSVSLGTGYNGGTSPLLVLQSGSSVGAGLGQPAAQGILVVSANGTVTTAGAWDDNLEVETFEVAGVTTIAFQSSFQASSDSSGVMRDLESSVVDGDGDGQLEHRGDADGDSMVCWSDRQAIMSRSFAAVALGQEGYDVNLDYNLDFVVDTDDATAYLAAHCSGDVNCDGGTDGDDVIAYFAAWDTSQLLADANGDSLIDGDDVILFFAAWDGDC